MRQLSAYNEQLEAALAGKEDEGFVEEIEDLKYENECLKREIRHLKETASPEEIARRKLIQY